MNRLGEMMADLPKAEGLRTQIRQLDTTLETALNESKVAETAWRSAQRETSDAESAVNMAKNQLPPSYFTAAKDLQNAEAEMARAASRGPEDTLFLTAQSAVEKARAQVAAQERRSAEQMQKIADLQKVVDAAKGKVDEAWTVHEAAGKAYDNVNGQRQKLDMVSTTQYSNLTPADIDFQAKNAASAERDLTAAQNEAAKR